MAAVEIEFPSGGQQGRILKWRVGVGTMVSVGRVLLLYHNVTSTVDGPKCPEKKLRATRFGRVTNILVKEGEILQPGQVVLTLEGCKHPTVMKDLCAECGADLREEDNGKDGEKGTVSQASVPMVHSIPELKVCPELAEKIGREDEQRLLCDRKLALLVDLDQTVVHTTNDNIPPDMKDVYHFQLYGPHSPWYHTRLRPGTRHFLSQMSRLYELHICTFGARNYAHTVAALLDKDGTLFSHRILSRDECFDPASKTANLKALFPCGDDMVCIIDDREDVWQGCRNLVQVKPYHFFRHTGDIHAPPGFAKRDIPLQAALPNPSIQSKTDVQDENNENGVSEKSNEETTEIKEQSKSTAEEEEVFEAKNEKVVDSENKNEEKESSDEKFEKEEHCPEKNEKEEHCAENNEKEEHCTEKNEKEECSVKKNETVEGQSEIEDKVLPEQNEEKRPNDEIAKEPQNIQEKDVKIKKKERDDEDHDDYLLYLEDILRRIHAEFYAEEEVEKGRRSLRDIIPRVRARVLKGLRLTFSGLVATHQKLHQSRAYKVARALGAEVTQDLTEGSTHLVAIKPGTAKANAAKKTPGLRIVNPDWLWTCAERWERVDERLYPLTTKARGSRIPPPHCSSPERIEDEEKELEDRFADSINPLMSFTQEEIENMDKEVEEDMSDQEPDAPTSNIKDGGTKRQHRSRSGTPDSLNEEDWYTSINKRRKIKDLNSSADESSSEGKEENDDDEEDDDPVIRFRRGGNLPDDLDLGDESQDSVDMEAINNEDDGEWNEMGAALEREFLSD